MSQTAKILNKTQFFCLGLVVVFTPWTYWPISNWFNLPVYDTGFTLLVIAFVLDLLFPRLQIPDFRAGDAVLLLFGVWLAFNSTYLGLSGTAKPVIQSLALFYIIAHAKFKKTQLELLPVLLVLGGIISSLIGIYQYFFLSHRLVSSSFGNPNLFSGYLSLLLPLSLSLWLHPKPLVKAFGIIATILLAFAMTITLTRMGWLVGIGGLCGFAVMKERKLLVVVLALVLVFGVTTGSVAKRFGQISQITDIKSVVEGTSRNVPVQNSVESRVSLWRFALREFEGSPFTGIGFGNFQTRLAQYLKANPQEGIHFYGVEDTHNSYIRFLVELGLPGVILFLLILVLWFGPPGMRILFRSGTASYLEAGIFWGISAFILHNFSNNLFTAVPTGYGFWVALGVLTQLNSIGG